MARIKKRHELSSKKLHFKTGAANDSMKCIKTMKKSVEISEAFKR